jgi:hypothetical protein
LKGFARKAVVARKKTSTAPSVPATYGMSSRLEFRLLNTASAE